MLLQKNSKISLFLGGGHSGKSVFAENCAKKWNHVVYYATGGQIENSPEWEFRIKKHRERRPEHWTTMEHPIGIEEVVKHCQEKNADVLLIDCLTLWIGWQIAQNIQSYSQFQLLKHLEIEYQHFIKQLLNLKCPVLVVSNEVGEGVIPGTESGRIFREALGCMNVAMGEIAQCISFSIAGQHLLIKSPSQIFKDGFCILGMINENFIYSEINQDSIVGENHVNK
jgi:adenosylcobinamide kinase / adenosylcobinamide-phosphate guanylyltransferase